jgi:2-polyprenyl-3-methyl-5-hydroxy-6-metoxy-1,4-benzoquinol methylase
MIIEGKEACHIPGMSSKLCGQEHIERYRFAAQLVKKKRVLDVACGVGYGAGTMARSDLEEIVACNILLENIT